jgi:hypothetical protein
MSTQPHRYDILKIDNKHTWFSSNSPPTVTQDYRNDEGQLVRETICPDGATFIARIYKIGGRITHKRNPVPTNRIDRYYVLLNHLSR